MPQIKAAFARLNAIEPPQYNSIAQRLLSQNFELGEGNRVIAVDKDYPRLTMQVVSRRLREVRHFDDAQGKMVAERSPVDRELYFSIDVEGRMAETPAARRDFAVMVDLLKRSGGGRDLEAQPVAVDLLAWIKTLLSMHETAQLSQVVFDGMYMEPRMIGRYTAKSVDNRLDLKYLEQSAGQLRSLRLGFFHDGSRRTVELRVDGTLAVSSADEDDAEAFFREQRMVVLKCLVSPGGDFEKQII